MSKEIKELENKYLVLKLDDIEKYLTPRGLKKPVIELEGIVTLSRRLEGKPENKYLVLNLDDEIDFTYLVSGWELSGMIRTAASKDDGLKLKVKDIAVDLVNAILKTKE